MKKTIIALSILALVAGCSSTASSSASSTDSAVSLTSKTQDSSVDIDDEDSIETYDESSAVKIALNGSTASSEGSGITVTDTEAKITSAGVYVFSGTWNDGTISVNSEGSGTVRIILNQADITSTDGPVIYVEEADKVIITSVSGTENTLNDAASYDTAAYEDVTAAVYSKDDLVINGSGKLTVNGNSNDAVSCNDSLKIVQADLSVTAVDDGLDANDTLLIYNSTVSADAQGDGIKAGKDDDAESGTIILNGSAIDVNAGNEGIQAGVLLEVDSGNITINGSGNSASVSGSMNQMTAPSERQGTDTETGASEDTDTETGATEDTDSTTGATSKTQGGAGSGMKPGGMNGQMPSGQTDPFSAEQSTDDGTVSSKALASDGSIIINDGTVTVTASFEALEAPYIEVNGGTLDLTSSDDGINVTGGETDSLVINGGTIVINAGGDGLDINGSGTMNNGTVTIYGPENAGNGSLDYDGSFTVNGGTLIAGSAAGMLMTPSDTSAVRTAVIGVTDTSSAVEIEDEDGNTILSYTSDKSWSVVEFSSELLETGKTYTVVQNGTKLGTISADDTVSYINTSASGTQNGMGGGRTQPGNAATDTATDTASAA